MLRQPKNHVLAVAARRHEPWDVLAFIGSLDVGGCERHLATVFPRLASAGLKVGIVTLVREGALANEVRSSGVDVVCLDRGYAVGNSRLRHLARLLLWLIDLIRLYRSGRVRVAHYYLPGAYIVGGMAAFAARFRNCVMSWRSLNDYQRGHRLATRIEHFLHRRMLVLSANAQASVEQLVEEGAPPERCVLLHNGVDYAQIDGAPGRAQARAQLGVDENSLTFVTVANLIPYKGHLDLIAAFGGIREQLPANWKLLLVGRDDGILSDVMRSAQNYGLDSNIQWLGQRSDVPTILRAADIGVMASHEEGMPNSLLEGMAASLPMVATSVGGVVDIISDGVDGLLAPQKNPAKLGAAMLRLAQDAALRSKLGYAARQTVEERFSIESNVAKYLDIYRRLLANDKWPPKLLTGPRPSEQAHGSSSAGSAVQ